MFDPNQQPNAMPFYPPVPEMRRKPKPEYRPAEKIDFWFMAIVFVLSFLAVNFALIPGFHLGFTITYVLLFAASTAYLLKKEQRPSVFTLLCGALSLAGSVTLSLYCNTLVNFFMLILIAGLYIIWCLGISGGFRHGQSSFRMLFDMLSAALLPFGHIRYVFGSIRESARRRKKSLGALAGVIFAVPALLIIVPLLMSSDAAFENLLVNFSENAGIYFLELLLACVIFPYAFAFLFGKRYDCSTLTGSPVRRSQKRFPVSGSAAFLAVISLTYLLYLFSQLAYFFSAFRGLLPEGYARNTSEFARRGFYEMFALCAINVLMISVVSALTKKNTDGKNPMAVKLLSLFISLFSIVLVISAMEKMRLNIRTYGFSRNKLLVAVLMLMIFAAVVLFIIHIFVPKLRYMQPLIIICSVMFIAFSFADSDRFTFTKNLEAYQNHTLAEIDLYQTCNFSPAETYYVLTAKSSSDRFLKHAAQMHLAEQLSGMLEDYSLTKKGLELLPTDFRAYNKAQADAKNRTAAYYKTLSAQEKADFNLAYFTMLHGGWYDYNADVLYDYEGEPIRKYNFETASFEEYTRPQEDPAEPDGGAENAFSGEVE